MEAQENGSEQQLEFLLSTLFDALADKQQELEVLVDSLQKKSTQGMKMKINVKKTKLTTNSANGIQREIKVNGQKLGLVTSFRYLEPIFSDDASKT